MSSTLRELIWLEVLKNPGTDTARIEVALGLNSDKSGVASYLSELYKARMVDRKTAFKPCANLAGKTRYFTYTVATPSYSWITPAQAKQLRAEKKAAKLAQVTEQAHAHAFTVKNVQHMPITPNNTASQAVTSVLAMLQSMSIADVKRVRAGIEQMFA